MLHLNGYFGNGHTWLLLLAVWLGLGALMALTLKVWGLKRRFPIDSASSSLERMAAMRWEFDDGGRAAAGYKGETGDCVVRAIAIATEKPYQEVYVALNDLSVSRRDKAGRSAARTGVKKTVIRAYLESLGWTWTPTMKIGSGCKVHLRDGELPMGRLVVSVSKHLVAVIDGIIRDNHDPSREGIRCVYGYWQKRWDEHNNVPR